jgi:glycerol uptake facilitator-like aquaporin
MKKYFAEMVRTMVLVLMGSGSAVVWKCLGSDCKYCKKAE